MRTEVYFTPEQEALPQDLASIAVFVMLYLIRGNYLYRTKSPHVTQI